MKKINTILSICLAGLFLSASIKVVAQNITVSTTLKQAFQQAYLQYPDIPNGLLEAVSFTNTRFETLLPTNIAACNSIPQPTGIMGLYEDGKGFFANNLLQVANLSNLSIVEIKLSIETEILAYAKSISAITAMLPTSENGSNFKKYLLAVRQIDAIPDASENDAIAYAKDAFLYQIYWFLKQPFYQNQFNFTFPAFDFKAFFGANNFKILSAANVKIFNTEVAAAGTPYINPKESADYMPALWNPAASCNYSSRANTPISAVTIHTIQGTYAGCISWFQNCNANVSAHYVIRSSDGQVTQMVDETDKAWHVGTENAYTIGIEHEGYVNNSAWYTTAMYASSADLCRDITNSGYGISPLRTAYFPWAATTYYNQSSIPGNCVKIKGHQHYPNQTHTDPGPNWNWNYFYKLINNSTSIQVYNGISGTIYDSGGNSGNYSNDERKIYTIQPTNATNLQITFSTFNVENTWDYLYIYDGTSVFSPLIGYYTGANSPGTINSTSGALTVEFRTDCATNTAGYAFSWTSIPTPPPDSIAPNVIIANLAGWQTTDFYTNISETDSGNSGLKGYFYQVIDFNNGDWRGNAQLGFFSDNFNQTTLHPDWTSVTGTWNLNNGKLTQTNEQLSNTNIYAYVNHGAASVFLYHFELKISGSGNNRRAGLHYFCSSPTQTNRGNSYFIWLRADDQKLQFYKVTNDVFNLEHQTNINIQAGVSYDVKVIYNSVSGEHIVYVNNQLSGTYIDTNSLTAGNYISFRTGNAKVEIGKIKVYKNRTPSAPILVKVGNCGSCDLRYQNQNPLTPSGKIKGIATDSANNISSIAQQFVNVDWTAPKFPATLKDGIAADVDNVPLASVYFSHTAIPLDTHSNVAQMYYALGTSPFSYDVLGWMPTTDTLLYTNLTLTTGPTYYWSLKAVNNAGLKDSIASDGFKIQSVNLIKNTIDIPTLYPNPVHSKMLIAVPASWHSVHLQLFTLQGKQILAKKQLSAGQNLITIPKTIAGGVYIAKLYSEVAQGKTWIKKIVIKRN